MILRPLFAASLGALCLALIPASIASAGDPVTVSASKKPGGPYENFITGNVKPGKSKLLYFSVETSLPGQVRFGDESFSANPELYGVKWFKGKGDDGKNITRKVNRKGGYLFDNSKTSYFTARVKRKQGGGEGFCLGGVGQVDERGDTTDTAYIGLDGESCAG